MKLNIAGNTPLYLPRDPISPMEAATKSYVDVNLSTHETRADLHLSAGQNTWIEAITASSTEVNYLSGVTSNVQTQLDSKLALSGGTLTGTLVLATDPVASGEAATKNYVDTQDALKVSKAGDIMTGYLVLHADPVSNAQAATKKYVDDTVSTHASDASLHVTAAQNTFLDGITVTSTEVNYLEGVTSGIQGQINDRLPLSGGTMTAAITLSGAPTENLHAASKAYVDSGLALKLDLAGGTITGQVKTSLDPVAAEDLSRKGYVDAAISAHATSQELHLTAAQNTWIDAITASSTEVNYLSGVTSGIQDQLDTKFDKAGGEITGDVTLSAGKTVFVSKVPAADNELVNKAYVDAKVKGQEWKDPISVSNLINDKLSTPPANPVKGDTYIVATAATGAWAGLEGQAVTFNGTGWASIQNRAITAGDRFGVKFTSATPTGGDIAAHAGKIVTLVSGAAGSYIWDVQSVTAGSSTLVFDPQATDFGVTYTYTDEGAWVPTNTSVNLTAGDGLSIAGNLISVNAGDGVSIVDDKVSAKLQANSGLVISAGGAIDLKLNAAELQVTANGVQLSNTVAATLADAVTQAGTSTVTGSVTFAANAKLVITDAPVNDADAVNKLYVAGVQSTLQGNIDDVNDIVAVLNTDPTTKTYVDTQDALKVAKAGDTMTGFLTLHAAPTTELHASTKKYVDDTVNTHATDTTIHVTATQKTFLNALTVSSTEVNTLVGVTSSVQSQLDAKVDLAGDTMTGELVLFGNPVNELGAVPKSLLDSTAALKVSKAGDTMTGFLGLHADPTADLHAATKKYVDSNITTHAADASLHVTAAQNTFLDAITVTSTEVNYLSGVTSGVQSQIDSKLSTSGGTMSGPITLSGAPTLDMHAANKGYVDSGLALKLNLSGGTMTGAIQLPAADPTAATEATHKGYVDAQITATKTYADTQDALKVAKAGDTMTGFLTLHAAPTADLHAATKKYVDDSITTLDNAIDAEFLTVKGTTDALRSDVDGLLVDPVTKSYVDAQDNTLVPKAGTTLTGYLTLHADPLQPMHPASKQYVDAVAQGLVTKPSVRFASTTNIDATYNNGTFGVNSTLTGKVNGALVVDGGSPVVGDRILVRLQNNASENGDYVVQQTGNASTPFILKRATLVDESKEVPGSYYYTYDGATLKGTGWVFTVTNPITFTIGTDPIQVNQFSGQGSVIAGAGMTIDGNTIDVKTADPTRIVVNSDSIDLAVSGVTPGGYTKVTVDGYGRVTTGENPNTLAGYGIADGQPLNANLTSLSGVTTAGVLVRTSGNDVQTRTLGVSGVGLSINNNGSGASETSLTITSNATAANTASAVVARDPSGNFAANVITADLTGNASTATALKSTRNFGITGDVTATNVTFDGTGDVSLTSVLSNTGVVAGTYTKVTVDAKGRLTAGENPTTVAGYGIVDAATITYVNEKIADLEAKLLELHAYVMSRI